MVGASLCLALSLAAADGGSSAEGVITAVHVFHLHENVAPAEPALHGPGAPATPPVPSPARAAAPGKAPAPVAPVLDVSDGTQRLARALIARDIETLVGLTPAPFSFDGSVARSAAEVRQRWAEILDRHPVERLRLYDVEVLGYDAAVKKYGKPPARLASVPFTGSQIAIANLNGRATVVVWRKRARGYEAVAISD